MSRTELLAEIESLRLEMKQLAVSVVEYSQFLEVSQKLDELIVLYHKTAC